MTRLRWFAGALTAAVYVALAWVEIGLLPPESGGLAFFDLRVRGYDVAEAEAYLAALTEHGKALVMGPIFWLDTAFPLLFGWFLSLLILGLGRAWLSVLPFAYTAVDLWENATVRRMILTGDVALADSASNLTQGKYALLLLVAAVLWMLWRDRARRG